MKLSSSVDVDFGFSGLATYLPLFRLAGKLTQINSKPQREFLFR
jgi:hypothetical protein